jgi:hypothetical protein
MCVTTNAITPAYIVNSSGITTNKLKPAKRRISFATVLSQVVVVPSRHELTVTEKENSWWTCRDQEHSRVQIARDIADVRRYGPFGNIESSYETACKLAVDDGIIELLKDSNLQSSDLQKWTSNGVGRGLESYISSYHGDQREDDSRHARTMVYFTQRKHQGVSSAQEISEIYAESSRPSLIYSLMMGEADSRCVSKQDDNKVMATYPTDSATP